jgi:hypothetical protein
VWGDLVDAAIGGPFARKFARDRRSTDARVSIRIHVRVSGSCAWTAGRLQAGRFTPPDDSLQRFPIPSYRVSRPSLKMLQAFDLSHFPSRRVNRPGLKML